MNAHTKLWYTRFYLMFLVVNIIIKSNIKTYGHFTYDNNEFIFIINNNYNVNNNICNKNLHTIFYEICVNDNCYNLNTCSDNELDLKKIFEDTFDVDFRMNDNEFYNFIDNKNTRYYLYITDVSNYVFSIITFLIVGFLI